MIERAVSTSVRCSPTARAPRVVTAISEPIAASEIATTDSATSTSIRVKPRSLRLSIHAPLIPVPGSSLRLARAQAPAGIQEPNRMICDMRLWVPAFAGTSGGGALEPFRGNNLNSSGEPVDADFVTDAKARQRDGAAARHAGREELDGRTGRPLIAARREQRIEDDLVRHLNGTAGRARADEPRRRVDLGDDLRAVADRRIAVGLEHGGGLDRIRLEPRPRGAARQRRDHDGGEDRHNREHAYHFEQREARFSAASS